MIGQLSLDCRGLAVHAGCNGIGCTCRCHAANRALVRGRHGKAYYRIRAVARVAAYLGVVMVALLVIQLAIALSTVAFAR